MKETKVIILQHSQYPQKIAAAAARLSYKDGTAEDIYNEIEEDKCGSFIRNVISIGHKSVIEHANFTIAFENVPVLFEQFLIEHRLAAYTVKSRRYVNYAGAGYIIPKGIKNTDKYNEYCDFLFSAYKKFVEKGIAVEDARFVLPYSFKTNIICTMNARVLSHFIYSCTRGRGRKFSEIKKIGEMLLVKLEKIAPALFENIDELEEGTYNKDEEIKAIVDNKNVEDKDKIEILSYTENPLEKVIISALIQQTSMSTEKAKLLVQKKEDKVLDVIFSNLRMRELEQINFTFRINQISLPILTHLARHRIQNLVVPTLDVIEPENYIKVPKIMQVPELAKLYEECFEKFKEIRKEFITEGVSRQALAYLMPAGITLDVQTTMNSRELFHFLKLRTCMRAQWEIRLFAQKMLKMLKEIEPKIFSRMGASCISEGYCPEGKKSCGMWQSIPGSKIKIAGKKYGVDEYLRKFG